MSTNFDSNLVYCESGSSRCDDDAVGISSNSFFRYVTLTIFNDFSHRVNEEEE